MSDDDDLDIPTFMRRGHPDFEAIAGPTRKPRAENARRLTLPKSGRARKRKTADEVRTLERLGFAATEIRSLAVRDAGRIVRAGKPAALWRSQRAMRAAP